jgi:uncharacterized protein
VLLVDANVFMYAAGAAHEHKQPSVSFLSRVGRGELEVAVDAEVLQEVLHRYRALGRWPEGRRVFDLVRTIVPEVVPVDAGAVDAARALLDEHPGLSARDALHAAVVRLVRAGALVSYDTDFDGIEGVRRLRPEDVP